MQKDYNAFYHELKTQIENKSPEGVMRGVDGVLSAEWARHAAKIVPGWQWRAS